MLYLFLAFFTGIILVVQMYINSQLSQRLDSFNGVFYNYFGAVIIFLVYFIFKPAMFISGTSYLSTANSWMFTGGLIGLGVVILCNYSFKNLSATYTTSLIILGQLATALLIDRIVGIRVEPRAIIGILLIAAGIGYNSYITSKV